MVKIKIVENNFSIEIFNDEKKLIEDKKISENGAEIAKKDFCIFLVKNRKFINEILIDVEEAKKEDINYKKAQFIYDILLNFRDEYNKQDSNKDAEKEDIS